MGESKIVVVWAACWSMFTQMGIATEYAQDSGAPKVAESKAGSDLAQQLANPISSLISVPFQSNFDFNAGPDDEGFRYTLNIQPVIPFSITERWNLVTRTIVPVIYQEDIVNDGGWSQFGLADLVQSFFLSPKDSGPGGLIWGVGPVFLWPTAGNDSLGAEQYGAGPTAVGLFQKGPWTYGLLAHHIWNYTGKGDRADVNATFLQPFLAYTTKKQTTFTLNTESTYDWETSQWTVPVNAQVSQLVKFGKQPVQFLIGSRYFAEGPSDAPEWGIRAAVTLLFPK